MKKSSGCLKSRKGFTLIELLTVVIIIGVLASIALPQYAAFKEKTIAAEAIVNLAAIMKAEEIYRLSTNQYVSIPTTAGITSILGVGLNTTNWTYSCKCILPDVRVDITATRTVNNDGTANVGKWIRLAFVKADGRTTWSGGHPNVPKS